MTFRVRHEEYSLSLKSMFHQFCCQTKTLVCVRGAVVSHQHVEMKKSKQVS